MIASSSPKRRLAGLAAAGLAALLVTAVADPAAARSNREREPKRDDSVLSRPAGVPLMAIVSLGEQRVTIYDAEGRILRAPVSTGQTGYETPAGIYSVIQKEAEHYSNLYDDASMPFMQRITWSGIALHAGVLPGHPASHGCIRMPHGFAERLFELTSMGMRVIVVPTDVTPAEIAHPALFKPRPIGGEVSAASPPAAGPGQDQPMRLGAGGSDANVPPPTIPPRRLETLKSIAAAKAAEAETAARKAEEARAAAAKLATESARLAKAQRLAEGAKNRAEALLKSAEEALAAANSNANPNPAATERAEEAKTKAQAKVAEAQAQLDAAKAAAEPKVEAADARPRGGEDSGGGEGRGREGGQGGGGQDVAGVGVHQPADAAPLCPAGVPADLRDPDHHQGCRQAHRHAHLYRARLRQGRRRRALERRLHDQQPGPAREPESQPPPARLDGYAYARRSQRVDRNAEPVPADVDAAKAALDRLSIPQEAIDRIAEVVSPGSALIVSDEAAEQGDGQGHGFHRGHERRAAGRHQDPAPSAALGRDYERPYGRSPYGRNPSFWW